MATKTLKIGLSDTDKQNMAQDIYEQVEALLFDEYDSSETYHENDFVVYNDKLYICIASSTTGTWDATKWQEAKLQDLVDLVNEGVASIDGKADTSDLLDGTIVVSKSLSAKELENVSEESGNTQEEPFIYQGTGTANGTASVDTSPVGKQLEKQGNTVCVNQYAKEFNTTIWVFNAGVTNNSIANGIVTFTATAQYGSVYTTSGNGVAIINGHKYLLSIFAKTSKTGGQVRLSNAFYLNIPNTNNSFQQVSGIITANASQGYAIYIQDNNASDWAEMSFKNFILIDLTQWFNGDIPQDVLDHPENFSRYYQGSLAYNEGTLVNCDGRYLECGGRNLWDEEWEVGGIDGTTGQNISTSYTIRSKNYIKVIPNVEYYFKSSYYCNIRYYDVNKNYLGYTVWAKDNHNNIPSNVCYIRFVCPSEYGTTYKNDITISLYYTTGDGYDQYYPYVEPKVYDTGTEVLRSAGSVKDYKEPNGTIHRLVGVVDLGTLSWSYNSQNNNFLADISDMYNNWNYNTIKPNITNALYFYKGSGIAWDNMPNMSYGVAGVSLRIKNTNYSDAATFKTAMSGVYLYYELATPTTEEGTTFSENIEIDDYGTMGWKDTNEVYVAIPQGCKIFYPAWYAGFIDSLGQREDIEWDAGNVVSQTQLSSSETARDSVDSQLKNAIGGTLRQCLCVKESLDFDDTNVLDLGSIDWAYSSTYGFFYANVLSLGMCYRATPKIICSKYKTVNANYTATTHTNKSITFNRDGNPNDGSVAKYLDITDTAYTDATAFKNAMKGVLLAYEKASS